MKPDRYEWKKMWETLLYQGNTWKITGLRKINYQCLAKLHNINNNNNNSNDNDNDNSDDIEKAFCWGFQVTIQSNDFFLFFFFFFFFCLAWFFFFVCFVCGIHTACEFA